MATLDVIKTITIRGSAEGVAEVERQLSRVAAGMEQVTVASAKQEKATLSVEAAYKKLQARYDQEFRAQQQLAQVQKVLNAARAQGLVTDQRASELMQAAIKHNNTWSNSLAGSTSATKNSRYELINLSRQLQDVGVGLASGQALFTVAIQQGTQIADVFATASASGRSLGKELLGLITPMRAFIAVTAVAVAAVAALEINLVNQEKALFRLSQRLDTPIEKLRTLQNVAAQGGQIGFDDFIKAMEQFGPSVDRAKLGLGEMAELFRRNGKNAGDLERDLLNVADLVERARSNQQKYQILQEAGLPATADWVRLLSQGRPVLEQMIKDFTEVNKRTDELGKGAEEFNRAWSNAWDNFKRNAQNAADATVSVVTKGLLAAADLFNRSQLAAFRARGFTEEQAARRLGEQGLKGGTAGVAFSSEEANRFYNNMRGAAGETEKINKGTKDINNNLTRTNQEGAALAQREQARVQLIGNLATLEEVISSKRTQLNEAEISLGVSLGKQKDQLVEIARLTEIARRKQGAVGALGDAATVTEKYAAAVADLDVKLADTTITQEQYNRAVFAANPIVKEVNDALTNLGSAMARTFIDGKNAAEAFNASLKAIAATAASEAIKNLIKGDIAGAAISGGVAAVAAIGSLLFGDDEDSKAAAEAWQQAAQEAQKAAEKLEAAQARQRAFEAAAETTLLDTNTLEGALKEFEVRAYTARFEEAKAGGEAMGNLEKSLAIERLKIINDFAEQVLRRQQSFQDRLLRATVDSSTLQGQLALFDRQAQREREAEIRAGNEAIVELDAALAAERENIIKDFNERAVELERQRAKEQERILNSLDDRILAATVNANTLEGALALFDRRAQREREAEIEAGGENIVKLEQALALERVNIIEDFNERSLELERQRVDQLNSFARDIATYVNSLFAGPESALSPAGRLQQAQSAFTSQLALAQSGNVDALATITKFAEDYRQAAQAFFGSSTEYQTILGQISAALLGIPAVSGSTDPVVQALINTVTPAIQATTTAVGGTTSAVGVNTTAVTSQTSTQSNENAQQLNQQQALVTLSNSANSLATAANSLTTSSNAFLSSIQSLLQAITNQTQTLIDIDAIGFQTQKLEGILQILGPPQGIGGIYQKSSGMYAPSGSIFFALAHGGLVPEAQAVPARRYGLAGGGYAGTDTVPAMLTPGEFVVRQPVAQANTANLASLNQTGRWPANDNVERLLALICEKLDINISAIVGQTVAITRETRFATRRRNAA